MSFSLAGLGWLYYKQGKYAEAEPLHKRALAIREKAFGPNHPDVASSLNGLGWLYYKQGKYDKAEPLHKRAIAIYENAFGPDYTRTAYPLRGLGKIYTTKGEYAKAEPLYKRSLEILEKTVPNHPDIADTFEEMAELYTKMGRDDEAKKLLDRANRIRAK